MQEQLDFSDKLQLIKDIYYKKNNQSLLENKLTTIENNLNLRLPKSLKEFYLTFGEDVKLLKCMYDITLPQELSIDKNIIIIAKEEQNVCRYGINVITEKILYIDDNSNESINQDIEDFLIYLLALQGTEYLDCIGTVDVGLINEIKKYTIKLTKTKEDMVFCYKDSIICATSGEKIFICAKNDDCMGSFEEETGLEINYL